ncbi:MAG: phosphoribosylglycinamide formyltransferase [Chloroflexi bacterium]|nr:MAG: phosphoribosylglycinamide formyltransferase [Chloroflexota bacterium]
MSRLRVGVLVSGRGSNLQALIEAAKDPFYPARVVMVCANRDCPALEIAKKAGISRQVFRLAGFPDRKARDWEMVRVLRQHGVELVVCAGYDAILEPEFAGTMDAVRMALNAGVAETGCTIHVVTKDVDQGPILAQRRVEVRPDDTVESLRERIQAEEHGLLAEVVRRLAGQPLPLSL